VSLTRPNLLIVIPDDVGADRASYALPTIGQTAKLAFFDLLADNGIRFPYCYVQPACSTTRATLLHGLLPTRTGIGEVVNPGDAYILPSTLPAVFAPLVAAGYAVRVVGKWHLQPDSSPTLLTDPIVRGAQRWRGTLRNLGGDYYNWNAVVDGTIVPQTTYATTQTAAWAVEDLAAMPEPWCLWLAPNAAHEPFHVPPDGTSVTGTGDDLGKFLAAAEALDHECLRVFQALRNDVRHRTLVLVLADNGSPAAVNLVPPGEGKGTTGEGGVRQTLIAWHSSYVPAIDSSLLSAPDLFATLLDLSGDTTTTRPADSVSFAAKLGANVPPTARPHVVAEKFQPNGFGPYQSRQRMAREARYKLRRWETDGAITQEALYDLATAPPLQDGTPLALDNLPPDAQQALAYLRQVLDTI
jgi:arylsulfatase A-like enzyme